MQLWDLMRLIVSIQQFDHLYGELECKLSINNIEIVVCETNSIPGEMYPTVPATVPVTCVSPFSISLATPKSERWGSRFSSSSTFVALISL